ncbi:MAG: VCBS repeat-containing protein [Saprospiraceae bacterium]|nr:VCBS repeat-containing protein [Candidatus Defluviibacterium haderslevense]
MYDYKWSNWRTRQFSIYQQLGTGGFIAITGDTIVKDKKPSDGATWADSDNDGDLDCYVVNWYNTKNLFYNNTGVGAFTQTQNAIETSGGYCETASWGDYDNDGLLDLYVTEVVAPDTNKIYFFIMKEAMYLQRY